VGADDDPLERDAERAADDVSRGAAWRPAASAGVAAGPGGVPAPAGVHEVLRSPGQPLTPELRGELEPRLGASLAEVRIHTGRHAADSAGALQADAYTAGQHVAFAAGRYAPETREGRRLLAHELAHTVQQRGAPAVVRRRRVPGAAGLAATVPAGGADFAAHRTGMVRLLQRAWDELSAAQRTSVRTAASGFGITGATDADLFTALGAATPTQLTSFAAAVRTAAPTLELGDPALIDTGPRPATADAANLASLVSAADTIFNTIASGANDADLTQVFGAANVATAKAKYAAARTRMNTLHGTGHIVTDRSGYNAEVGLGGLTNSAQISVSPQTIDNPALPGSVVTLIHESMHAGNSDVRDYGYIHQPSFTALDASVKLTNAAHFEVVPRRILGTTWSFPGVTFIPAGTTVGGVTAPALTPREQAIRDTSETFRLAWTVGLNLHKAWVRVFRNPTQWATLDLAANYNGAEAGSRFSTVLPYWSKVEMLTVHQRAGINPAGGADAAPVTLIDVALSEGVVRRLNQGMRGVPPDPAAAAAFELANATLAERTAAAASAAAETALLKRLVLRERSHEITGATSRDEHVLDTMAQAGRGANYTDYFRIRTPSAFPF
jgi:hypothetical protein